MIHQFDPDGYVSVFAHTTCSFHEKYPELPFAGCTCSMSFRQRAATPEEREANRKNRLEQQARADEAYGRNR